MKILNKEGKEITSEQEWLRIAPPARKEFHWKKGRSAFELAHVWFEGEEVKVPIVLQNLLNSSKELHSIKLHTAFAEVETKLDNYGKGRVHDLLIRGTLNEQPVLISIEAKADETFGEIIGKCIEQSSETSKLPIRIKLMASALLEERVIYDLRYQLLHGVAGTLIEAQKQGASVAIFIVHQFISNSNSQAAQKKNNADLDAFVSRLTHQTIRLTPGHLIGPVAVTGGATIPNNIPLYIGKIVSVV
ncbi:DUF6946 family protein [Psychrobacillus sp. NPDC096623]|uniref:DUF6946 family protein n=1 Tax=Psychrobacillus sp. NPDC096623 TaxID=3364492 RepID=UPI0038126EEE